MESTPPGALAPERARRHTLTRAHEVTAQRRWTKTNRGRGTEMETTLGCSLPLCSGDAMAVVLRTLRLPHVRIICKKGTFRERTHTNPDP